MFDETKLDDPVTDTPPQPETPTVTRLSDDSPDAARYAERRVMRCRAARAADRCDRGRSRALKHSA
jgi:hypothetical protein